MVCHVTAHYGKGPSRNWRIVSPSVSPQLLLPSGCPPSRRAMCQTMACLQASGAAATSACPAAGFSQNRPSTEHGRMVAGVVVPSGWGNVHVFEGRVVLFPRASADKPVAALVEEIEGKRDQMATQGVPPW